MIQTFIQWYNTTSSLRATVVAQQFECLLLHYKHSMQSPNIIANMDFKQHKICLPSSVLGTVNQRSIYVLLWSYCIYLLLICDVLCNMQHISIVVRDEGGLPISEVSMIKMIFLCVCFKIQANADCHSLLSIRRYQGQGWSMSKVVRKAENYK